MLEYPEGGLEACVELECCYCWVAGTSTSGVGQVTRESASTE